MNDDTLSLAIRNAAHDAREYALAQHGLDRFDAGIAECRAATWYRDSSPANRRRRNAEWRETRAGLAAKVTEAQRQWLAAEGAASRIASDLLSR